MPLFGSMHVDLRRFSVLAQRPVLGLCLAALLSVFMSVDQARAEWPDKPITLVVGFTAGAGTDTIARVVATHLSKELGQRIVVENRPGANANIAAETVARAAPDGYTFLYNTTSFPISAGLYKKLSYDPIRDFRPVARVATLPLILVATPKFPPSTLSEFIAYLKANPDKANYASGGAGNILHLAMEMLLKEIGAKATHIAYKGISQANTDLLSGEVQLMLTGISSSASFIASKQLKAIAVLSPTRLSQLPDVPTIAEGGYPGFAVDAWYGVLAPANTPDEIVRKMSQAIERTMANPEVVAWFNGQGGRPFAAGPEEYTAYLGNEISRYKKIINDIDLKTE